MREKRYCIRCGNRPVDNGRTICYECEGKTMKAAEEAKPSTCSVKGCDKYSNLAKYNNKLYCPYHLVKCSKKIQGIIRSLLTLDYRFKDYSVSELREVTGVPHLSHKYLYMLISSGILKRNGERHYYRYYMDKDSLTDEIMELLEEEDKVYIVPKKQPDYDADYDDLKAENDRLKDKLAKAEELIDKAIKEWDAKCTECSMLRSESRKLIAAVKEMEQESLELIEENQRLKADDSGHEVMRLKAEIYDLKQEAK